MADQEVVKRPAKKAAAPKKVAAPKKAPAQTAGTAPKKETAPKAAVSKAAPKAAIASALRAEMIAEAAYYRAERRGFGAGGVVDDWLAAEREIDAKLARG